MSTIENKEANIEKISEFIKSEEMDSYFATYQDSPFLIIEGCEEEGKIEEFIGMDLYKAIGDDCGFSDEYTTCGNCGEVIRTSPDSYSWVADYAVQDCEIHCNKCIDRPQYLENLVNNFKNANTILEEQEILDAGFTRLDDYEAGWYGRYDNPEAVYNSFSDEYREIVFSITSQGQFETDYCAYGRGKYSEEGNEEDE